MIKQKFQHKETAEEVKYKKLRLIFTLCANFAAQCISEFATLGVCRSPRHTGK
jgi:hypothetical protein